MLSANVTYLLHKYEKAQVADTNGLLHNGKVMRGLTTVQPGIPRYDCTAASKFLGSITVL